MLIDSPTKPVVLIESEEDQKARERRHVCLRAAQILDTCGWDRGLGGMRQGDHPKCLGGAVAQALGVDAAAIDLHGRVKDATHYVAMRKRIVEILGAQYFDQVWRWNDSLPVRKKDDLEVNKQRCRLLLHDLAHGADWFEATGTIPELGRSH